MKTRMFLGLIASVAMLSCQSKPQEEIATTDVVQEIDVENVEWISYQSKSEKRGVSFNFEQVPDYDFPCLGPAISWFYNWSSSVPSDTVLGYMDTYGVDFCPMIWNGSYVADNIRSYKSLVPSAEYILAFNEPNLTDQANMTPSKAASYWPDVVALAKETGMKLVSPAMNYGTLSGYSDPVVWLDEFFACDGVSLDDVDAIAVHCYMYSITALQSFINKFEKYGKPIWLTEFCGYSGSAISEQSQINYMVECINYLETSPLIGRYAWFIPRGTAVANVNNYLLTSRSPFELTSIGNVFVNMSTCDDSVFYEPGQIIQAEHYVSASTSAHLRETTDQSGVLDVSDLKSNAYVCYQVNCPTESYYTFELRYTNYSDSAALDIIVTDISDEDAVKGEVSVPMSNLGKVWDTTTVNLTLPAGKWLVKLQGSGPSPVYLNYWRFYRE